jgi:hypothetical protein
MTDGQTTTVSTTLHAVLRDQSLVLHWKRSEFADLGPSLNPTAAAEQISATVWGYPRSSWSPMLLSVWSDDLTTDVDLSLRYGDPHPTPAGLSLDAEFSANVPIGLGSSTETWDVAVGFQGPLDASGEATFART